MYTLSGAGFLNIQPACCSLVVVSCSSYLFSFLVFIKIRSIERCFFLFELFHTGHFGTLYSFIFAVSEGYVLMVVLCLQRISDLAALFQSLKHDFPHQLYSQISAKCVFFVGMYKFPYTSTLCYCQKISALYTCDQLSSFQLIFIGFFMLYFTPLCNFRGRVVAFKIV